MIDRRHRKKAQDMEHTNMMDKRSFFMCLECAFLCCVIMRKNTTIRQHNWSPSVKQDRTQRRDLKDQGLMGRVRSYP